MFAVRRKGNPRGRRERNGTAAERILACLPPLPANRPPGRRPVNVGATGQRRNVAATEQEILRLENEGWALHESGYFFRKLPGRRELRVACAEGRREWTVRDQVETEERNVNKAHTLERPDLDSALALSYQWEGNPPEYTETLTYENGKLAKVELQAGYRFTFDENGKPVHF